jgi:hypothetical protein
MKKLTLLVALIALSAFAFQAAFSQQTVNITVGSVQKLAIVGGPATLTIGDGQATAGTDLLADVSSPEVCTYSITHNGVAAVKITAAITVGGNWTLGTSSFNVNVAAVPGATSDGDKALSTVAADVVYGIAKGAGGPAAITYKLTGVKASDGTLAASKTITYTISN